MPTAQITFKEPIKIPTMNTLNVKSLKIQITPIANSNELPTIVFVMGEDDNGRQYIEFSGSKYYKEQTND